MMPGQAHRKAKMLISIFSFIIGCLLNIALLLLLFGPVTLRLISNLSHGLIDRQTSNVAGLVALALFLHHSYELYSTNISPDDFSGMRLEEA